MDPRDEQFQSDGMARTPSAPVSGGYAWVERACSRAARVMRRAQFPSLLRSGGEGRGEEALVAKARDFVGEINTPLSNSLPARPSRREREERPSRAVSNCSPFSLRNPHSTLRTGFSLLEMMVTVAILTVIILGLTAMFNQTRRAFVSSMTQVDVLESGRMAADMIGRDLEQMTPCYTSNYEAYNLYFDIRNSYFSHPPLLQALTDTNDYQVNNHQEMFFVTRYNLQYNCIGFRMTDSDYQAGIGVLYRYGSTNISYTNYAAIQANFNNFYNTVDPSTNSSFSRIIDGVVDFRIRIYDNNGMPIYTNSANSLVYMQTNLQSLMPVVDYTQAQFWSNALPAYVEVELGVLEDRALARYKALTPNPAAAVPGGPGWSYLTNHAGAVHIFRQRIPIRNFNSSGYP